jgi:nicotinamide-nucleotide amidase
MRAETIAIGSELTTGAKLDTNSQWLSIELAALGIPVHFHTTVADDLEANVGVIRIAVERADLVLLTGGLGPTLDDLTREALARAAGVELVLDEPSLENIRGMFARRQREMPERNRIQAMFPVGSTIVPNPRGTAPGIALELPRAGRGPCFVVALPGVPSEMKPMFAEWVRPRLLAAGAGGRVIRRARVHIFGLGESACEEMLGEITARGRDPEVGITVHEATITLRIVAEGATGEECEAKIALTRRAIVERMGDWIFGEEDEELHDVVVRELRRARETLATAEGGTSGLLASWLGAADGYALSAPVYLGGLVLPGPAALRALIGGDCAVSGPALAEVLARSARERLGATYGIGVTAASGAVDAGEGERPGSAFVAVVGPNHTRTTEMNLAGDPAITRVRLAKTALNLLRLMLGR